MNRGWLLALMVVVACRAEAPTARPADVTASVPDAAASSEPPDAALDAVADVADAAPVDHVPSWDSGDVTQRLRALGVHDDDWARRDLVSWTTRPQVDALRSSKVLLVATANTGGPPSPFVYLLDGQSRAKNAAGALAKALFTEERFSRRRYAWTAGYATVLGLLQKRYGDQLVAIRLKSNAWIVELDPAKTPTMRVRDLAQHEITLDEAVLHRERIAAVYHVRKGSDVPRPFREYVVVNEAEVERWAVGTPDVVAEVDAEARLLRELRALLDPDGGATKGSLDEAWKGTLAFDNDRYGKLDLKHLDLAIEGLASYVRTEEPLAVSH